MRDSEPVVRAPATVRVTVTRGAERDPRRGAATTGAKPGRRGGWRRARLGVSPHRFGSAWSVGREGEWRGSCANNAVDHSLQSLELESEPTKNRIELLTTLAPLICARAGGLWLWKNGPGEVASEGVEARLPKTLKEEKPMWRTSNLEREVSKGVRT